MSNFNLHRLCFIGYLFHLSVFGKFSVVFSSKFFYLIVFILSVFELQVFYFFVSLLGSKRTGCLSLLGLLFQTEHFNRSACIAKHFLFDIRQKLREKILNIPKEFKFERILKVGLVFKVSK